MLVRQIKVVLEVGLQVLVKIENMMNPLVGYER